MKKITPKKVYNYLRHYKSIQQYHQASKRFVDYERSDEEYRRHHLEECKYIENHGISMYPYEWFWQLPEENYVILNEGEYFTAIYHGKKLFYDRRFFNPEKIQNGLNFYDHEQYAKSPHCYLPPQERPLKNNAVIVECGASEGTFSLSIIEKIKKAYIFEGDPKWVKGLRKTFEPYGDKVIIIDKYVDSYSHTGGVRDYRSIC